MAAPLYVQEARNQWFAFRDNLEAARDAGMLLAAEAVWLYNDGWTAFKVQMVHYADGDCED
jgi:hypothetical protein